MLMFEKPNITWLADLIYLPKIYDAIYNCMRGQSSIAQGGTKNLENYLPKDSVHTNNIDILFFYRNIELLWNWLNVELFYLISEKL